MDMYFIQGSELQCCSFYKDTKAVGRLLENGSLATRLLLDTQ